MLNHSAQHRHKVTISQLQLRSMVGSNRELSAEVNGNRTAFPALLLPSVGILCGLAASKLFDYATNVIHAA